MFSWSGSGSVDPSDVHADAAIDAATLQQVARTRDRGVLMNASSYCLGTLKGDEMAHDTIKSGVAPAKSLANRI